MSLVLAVPAVVDVVAHDIVVDAHAVAALEAVAATVLLRVAEGRDD